MLPSFVYEAIDPVTKLPFYVGRTGDMDRRAREHQKRCMKKIRELMKLKDFKFRDVQRRVPELPDGCAPKDAQELEAYFIFERDTPSTIRRNAPTGAIRKSAITARSWQMTVMTSSSGCLRARATSFPSSRSPRTCATRAPSTRSPARL